MNRKGFLEGLIGKDKTEETQDDLKAAIEKLDELGLERKELTIKDAASAASNVLAALVAAEVISEEMAANEDFLQLIVEAITAGLEEASEEERAEDEDESVVAEDKEEEEEEEKEEEAEGEKAVDEVLDFIYQTTKDVGALAETQIGTQEAIKAIGDVIQELAREVADLKKHQAGAPRVASEDSQTVVSGDANKDLIEQIKASIDGEYEEVLGLRVRKEA